MIRPIIEFFSLKADRPVPETRSISVRQRFIGKEVCMLGVSRGAMGLKTVKILLAPDGTPTINDFVLHTVREPAEESRIIKQLLSRYDTKLVIGLLGLGYTASVSNKTSFRPSDLEVQRLIAEEPAKLLPPEIMSESEQRYVPVYHPTMRTALFFMVQVKVLREFETLLRNCGAVVVRLQCGGIATIRHLVDKHPEIVQTDGAVVIIDQTTPFILPIANRNWISTSSVVQTNFEQTAIALLRRLRALKVSGKIHLINTTEWDFADAITKGVRNMEAPFVGAEVIQPFENDRTFFDFHSALHA
jgi:hypothetical protein